MNFEDIKDLTSIPAKKYPEESLPDVAEVAAETAYTDSDLLKRMRDYINQEVERSVRPRTFQALHSLQQLYSPTMRDFQSISSSAKDAATRGGVSGIASNTRMMKSAMQKLLNSLIPSRREVESHLETTKTAKTARTGLRALETAGAVAGGVHGMGGAATGSGFQTGGGPFKDLHELAGVKGSGTATSQQLQFLEGHSKNLGDVLLKSTPSSPGFSSPIGVQSSSFLGSLKPSSTSGNPLSSALKSPVEKFGLSVPSLSTPTAVPQATGGGGSSFMSSIGGALKSAGGEIGGGVSSLLDWLKNINLGGGA